MHRSDVRPVVGVWTAGPVGWDVPALLRHLDAAELARACALPPDQAARFVTARALLRGVLAGRRACAPREVDLIVTCARCGGPHGRVAVAASHEGERLHVSLTRSGPVVAVALTAAGPVGVDVESCAAVGAAPLADVALAPAERPRLGRPAGAALARTWVRKEAALKALGTGLLVDPAELDLGPAGRPRGGVAQHRGTALAIAPLALGDGLVGAVAVVTAVPGPGWARRTGRGPVDLRLHDGAAVLAALTAG